MAQLTIPVSHNFSDALAHKTLNAPLLQETGGLYEQLLLDLDKLLATDPAFLLGR